MALITAYNTGTASVANGSKAVTGVGTAWLDIGLTAGDVFWNANGTASQRIDTVTDNTHMTLVNNWGGTTLTGATYEVRITPPSASIAGTVRAVLEYLANGVLSSIASLTNTVGNYMRMASGGWESVSAADVAVDVETSDVRIHVFLSGGQSNMSGNTTSDDASTNSPVPQDDTAFKYDDGTLGPCVNNMAGGVGGPLPAFAIAYYKATGVKVCIVTSAKGGSGMLPASDDGNGNWSPSGTLYTASKAKLTAALAALTAAGYAPMFKGIIWSQGEADGNTINASGETKADYKTATIGMIANYRTDLGDSSLPFYIFKTGTEGAQSDTGFSQVRAAQEEIAAADPYTHIVFRNALDFQTRTGYVNTDLTHYTQTGYNEMGTVGAANVVALNSVTGFQFPALGSTDIYYNGGKVGIGTASPGALSHVWQGASGAAKNANALQILEGSTTTYHQIIVPASTAGGYLIGNPTSGNYGGILMDSSGKLNLRTNATTAFSIDGSGYVTVGSGTPQASTPLSVLHSGANSQGVIIGDPSATANDTGIYLRTTGFAHIGVGTGGGVKFDIGGTTNMALTSAGFLGVGTAGPRTALDVVGDISPHVDNSYKLGNSSFRFSQLYAGTATINTSGAETKTAVRELSDTEIAVALELQSKFRIFQFADAVAAKGQNARLHAGVIAEDVFDVFTANGIDPFRYGICCRDPKMKPVTKTRKVERAKTQTVNEQSYEIVVEDGVAKRKVISTSVEQSVIQKLPLFDESGEPVLDEDGIQVVHAVAVTETVSEEYEEMEPALDADGNPAYTLGLRYTELQQFVMAGIDARLSRFEAAHQ